MDNINTLRRRMLILFSILLTSNIFIIVDAEKNRSIISWSENRKVTFLNKYLS
ncbi:hypothetical protein N9N95_02340 [Methylophilaceae bacterium]|nr:hypothetical protein [Methylophilaceae bacterium]